MNKKIVRRYMLLCLPFGCGIILYGVGIYNIVSSLLFFCGGYVALKNIVDYRMVKKNIKKCDMRMTDIYIKKDNDRDIDGNVFCMKNNDYMSINNMSDNIDSCMDKDDVRKDIECKYKYRYKNSDMINGFKNTRRYVRIRRRY